MPEQNYTMLFPEILDRVSKAKTKEEKVTILRENNTDSLRIVLKSSFDPKIEWVFPEGTVPYTPNDVPAGIQCLHLKQRNCGTTLKVQIIKLNNIKKNLCSFSC